MFCDLVGSTPLSSELDPEEFNDVTREYQSACAEVVDRHEGCIAQFLGDGLLVYFGYPLSHEDDAPRAVRAGLEMVEAISRLRERLGKPLQVRIAVHTGLVVVGHLGGETNPDPMAIQGETPNVAARIQAIAEPGAVVVSDATYRLIHGYFVCRSLGTPTLKGVNAPIEVFEVVEPTGIHTRFEKAVASGLTPMVGRDQELELLIRHWEESTHGHGQVVMLSGEPGIGKSRLLRMLKERTGGEWVTEFEGRCSPYYRNSALSPAIEFLQNALFQSGGDAEIKFVQLEAKLAQYGFSLPDSLPLFAALLSLPPNERYPALPITPQRQKQKTFEAIVEFLLRAAEQGPTRLIIEDLHWADPTTVELLELLIEDVPRARLFVALAFRPDFLPPWPAQSHVRNIPLGRLSRRDIGVMVRSIAGGKSLPIRLVDEIATTTEGVPLFIEELTEAVLEAGVLEERDDHYSLARGLPSLEIPSTLYDSLMSRLDRLGTAKEVAQMASIIGREFTYELLRAISPLEETRLTSALNRLVHADLLEEYSSQPPLAYHFKHALIRDAAYESLLRSRRRRYHAQIANVLMERFPEITESHPELLASHYTEAGLPELAIPWWQKAGQRALERSANQEAVQHLTMGLDLLGRLPETAEGPRQETREQLELSIRAGLGSALMATKGYAAPEVENAFARAKSLCQRMSLPPELEPVLFGLFMFYIVRGQYHTAYELGDQLLGLAEQKQTPTLLIDAHVLLGGALFYRGVFVQARHHLEQALSLLDERPSQKPLGPWYGQDRSVLAHSWIALTLWCLGQPEKAVEQSAQAIGAAGSIAHPFSQAFALTFGAVLHQLRGESLIVRLRAEEALRISIDQQFSLFAACDRMLLGWALKEERQVERGIEQIFEGMRAFRASGAALTMPYYLAMLADAYCDAGRLDDAMGRISDAKDMMRSTGEGFYKAEIYRLNGIFLSKSQRHSQSNASLQDAIETARHQHAKSFELRSAITIFELAREQDEQRAATNVLRDIYSEFHEGFKTSDLARAAQLIGARETYK